MASLLDLFVKIGVKDEASGEVEGITSGIIAKGVAMGNALYDGAKAAGSALIDLGKSALDSYANFEQLQGGVEKLFNTDFGNAASTVMANAENAFRTAGMSANQYMEQVTMFSSSLINSLGGDTQTAANLADVAIRAMSDNVNVFGSDMQSVQDAFQGFAKGNYEMLDNLRLGYGGTQTEMQRLIKDASELTGVQEELGLTVDGNSMSFDNIVKAIQVMQTEMGIAGTTSKEASQTIEGSINQMSAAWDNWITGLGRDDAGMYGLTNQLVESIGNVIDNVLPRIGKIAGTLVATIGNYAPQVAASIGSMLSTGIQQAMATVASYVGQGDGQLDLTNMLGITPESITAAFQQLITFIGTNLPILMQAIIPFITQGLTLIISNLPAILTGLMGTVYAAASTFMVTLGAQLPTILGTLLPALITALQTLITNFIANFPTYLEMIKAGALALFNGIVQAIPEVLPGALGAIGTLIGQIITNIPTFIGTLLQAAVDLFCAIVDAIPVVLPAVLEGIGNLLKNVWDAIANFDLAGVGRDLIQGLINGIGQMAQSVVNTVTGVVNGAIEAAKSFLGIGSPSKLFKQYGIWTMEGFENGVESMLRSVRNTMGDFSDSVTVGSSGVINPSYGAAPALASAGAVSNNYYIGDTLVTDYTQEKFAERFVALMDDFGRLARS